MQSESHSISLVEKDVRTGRIVWADNAKAILITLVVLGHFTDLDLRIKAVIYAFHLPAFLFITGFFLPANLASQPFGQFAKKYILPFARLYLFVTAASILLWWIAYAALRSQIVSPVDAILNGLYGTQWQGHLFIHKNGAIWYLPFLICSLAATYAASRLAPPLALLMIAAAFAFAVFYSGYPLPWSAGATGVGVAFVYAGIMLRRYVSQPRDGNMPLAFSRMAWGIIGIVAFLALVGLSLPNGVANINLLELGTNPLVFLAATIAFCVLIPHSRFLDELSTYSLVIFCVHLYAVKVVNHAHLFQNQPAIRTVFLVIAAIAIATASMIVSKAVQPWLNKFVLKR